MNIWHRDNLDEWRTSAVQINEGIIAKMRQFTSVFLKVSMLNFNIAAIWKMNDAGANNWLVHLRNLVTLWQIRVVIMFAVKAADKVDLAVHCETSAHRLFDGCFVEHWQHTRKGIINWAHAGVWFFVSRIVIDATE